MVRTAPFQGVNTGSTPVGAAIMPTIKELGLQSGQHAFCFGVEKRMRSGGILGGLSLKDALVDPKAQINFALVEILKIGEHTTILKLICASDFISWSTRSSDFEGVEGKDIRFIHSLYPNYIMDGIGPEVGEISPGVQPSPEPFQRIIPLFSLEGEPAGELIVDNNGMRWSLEQSCKKPEGI